MSLLAASLAQTAAVRVFADVGNLPLRPPAVLALAAPPDPHTLTTFIEDVAPKVRELVAERRARA
jgi:hypothetical protein